MRLIFAYIDKFRNYRQQSINFVGDFRCVYEDNRLLIRRQKAEAAKEIIFKDSLLKDLSLIVGETGSGKTNLLQLLGMDKYGRADLKKDDSYLLIFEDSQNGHFILELCNLFPEDINLGITTYTDKKYGFTGLYDVETDDEGHPSKSRRINNDYEFRTYMVSCFDLNAFAYSPCEDEHRDGLWADKYFPRITSPFGRTNIGIACEQLHKYINSFSPNNIKRCAALSIKAFNWSDKLPIDINDEIREQQYWTYRDKRFERIGKRNKRPIKQSHKKQFLHDLLADYALYLRKWAATVDESADDEAFEAIANGLIEARPQYMLPDYLGGGGTAEELLKRIEWLGSYIDSHFEEYGSERGLVWQITTDIRDIYHILCKFDDKYFSEETFSLPIVDMDFSNRNLSDLFERMTAYRSDEYGIFTKELLPYEITAISSGEYQYAKTLGAIDEFCVRLKIASQRNRDEYYQPDFILLLDEPEAYMHPELCRRFITLMNEILQKHSAESNIQIVLSTHSPFMLSDVLSSQVIRLRADEDGYCQILPQAIDSTFAGGIHSIMANEFFLKFTIGEYSRKYLSDCLSRLQSISWEKLLSDDDKKFIEDMDVIQEVIGDKVLRSYFSSLLKSLK